MNLCDNGHDEICFIKIRHRDCPLCDAQKEIEDLKNEVEKLNGLV